MVKPKPRRGGRPKTRKAKPGERVHLGLRVSPDLKRHLERAAVQSTRSLSQEVEFRLEQSLHRIPQDKVLGLAQAMLQQAMDIHGRAAGERGEVISTPSKHGPLLLSKAFIDDWLRDFGQPEESDK